MLNANMLVIVDVYWHLPREVRLQQTSSATTTSRATSSPRAHDDVTRNDSSMRTEQTAQDMILFLKEQQENLSRQLKLDVSREIEEIVTKSTTIVALLSL